MTQTPATLTYASMVSCESVRIALTMAALHDLEVKTGDIKNAYLTVPVAEKIWTVCGPEFRPDQGKRALFVRSLYGLKSAGASFRKQPPGQLHPLPWIPSLSGGSGCLVQG